MTIPAHTDPTDLRVPQALAGLRRELQRRGQADGGLAFLVDRLEKAIAADRQAFGAELVRRATAVRDELEGRTPSGED